MLPWWTRERHPSVHARINCAPRVRLGHLVNVWIGRGAGWIGMEKKERENKKYGFYV
jgi:hypothetical protein